MRAINPRYSPARFAWLQRLERELVVDGRGKGPVGCQCMRLGWTCWVFVLVDRNAPASPMNMRAIGETLTAEGKQQLARWREI